MKNPARLCSWIRKYGTLGLRMATVAMGAFELLLKRRFRVLMVSSVFCTLVCLLLATTTLWRGSSEASAQVASASQTTTPSPTTKVPRTREYTLTRLVTGVSWQDRTRAPRKDETWASLAGFRVTEQGKPAPWEPVSIAVTDGKGKKWDWVGGGNTHQGNETLHHFLLNPVEGMHPSNPLRPDTGEWHLRVEFSRTRGFDPADLWTVSGIPVPKKGQTTDYKIIASTLLHGTKVELRQLVPPGESLGEDPEMDRNTPAVSILHTPRREGLRMDLVKATDDRGREVKTSFLSGGSGGDHIGVVDPTYRSHYSLDGLRPGVKTVNLTFALHESDYAEFTAKPTVFLR